MASTPTSSPVPVPAAAGPTDPARRRMRWGLAAGTVIGALMVLAGLSRTWLSAWVYGYQADGGYESCRAGVPLGDIDTTWARLVEVGSPVLAVLSFAAVVGPARWRRGVAAATMVVAAVVVGTAAWGWVDLQRPARAVAESVAAMQDGGRNFVPWEITRITPVVVAAGAVVLAQVAAHVCWPRSAPRVLTVAGVASAVTWVAVPFAVAWSTEHGPAAVEARPLWLASAGATGVLAVVLVVVLAGLAIVSVVSDPVRLRALVPVSVVTGLVAVVVYDAAWLAGSDEARAGPRVVSLVEGTSSHLILGCAVSFLVLACVVARRERRATAPAAASP